MPDSLTPRPLTLPRRTLLATAAGAALAGPAARAEGRGIAFVIDPADAIATAGPALWATGLLRETLAARGNTVRTVAAPYAALPGDLRLVISGSTHRFAHDVLGAAGAALPEGREALALVGAQIDGNDTILAAGTDARGLVYALTDLLDRIATEPKPGDGLRIGRPLVEHPANRVRSVARCLVSEIEDKPWLHDRDFWREYLTMLVSHRFNRFSLHFGLGYDYPAEVSDVFLNFAYPFLFAVPGYDVRVGGLADEERDRNLASLKFIAEEAGRRGLDFQIGLWTHAYRWDSPRVNYLVTGVAEETHAAYCADALARLLTDIPQITGVTLRADAASGIAAGDAEFWRTLFRGIARALRPIEIDLHGAGVDRALTDAALATGLPVKISPPTLGEQVGLPYHTAAAHPAAVAGYGDFLREDRKHGIVWRVWPGTQRVLAWADPVLFAGYAREAGFCGADGMEIFEPLSLKGRMGSGRYGGRAGYADRTLAPARDWQKSALFYRMWGRLTYDPAAPPDSWHRATAQSLGAAAADTEAALAAASRILPLVSLAHAPSALDTAYWPEMVFSLPIVHDGAGQASAEAAPAVRFGSVESADPRLFATVGEAAEALIAATPEPRLTPVDVAAMLDGLAGDAMGRLEAARRANVNSAEFRRLAVDIAMQAELGRFFADKFRAAMLWSIHLRGTDRVAGDEALKAYRAARAHLAEAGRLGGVYAGDLTYGPDRWLRGHWRDRTIEVDLDIADMIRTRQDTNGMATGRKLVPRARLWAAIGQVLAAPRADRPACRHVAPARFTPGRDLALGLGVPDGVGAVKLHYRHVSQAEGWVTTDMAATDNRRTASIPAAYLGPAYPLQYYFELAMDDAAALYPGLDATLAGVPYYLVRAAPGSS